MPGLYIPGYSEFRQGQGDLQEAQSHKLRQAIGLLGIQDMQRRAQEAQQRSALIEQEALNIPQQDRGMFRLDPSGFLTRRDNQQFRAQESDAAREARRQELEMRLQDSRLNAQDRANLQRELAQMQARSREDMLRLGASLRQPAAIQTTTIQDPNDPTKSIVIDARTRQKIGDAPPKQAVDKPMTEFQGKSALYGTRAQSAHDTLLDLEGKISTTGLAAKQAVQGVPVIGGALGAAGNLALSANQQSVEQAQRNFVNAVLRQESGAVISDQEFENAKRQYFAQPGDTPQVLQQKRENRMMAISGFERMSGKEGGAAIQDVRGQAERRRGDRRGAATPLSQEEQAELQRLRQLLGRQ